MLLKKILNSDVYIWAAPEGTRSQNGKLLPFKKGIFAMAAEINALIIPISIKNAHKILPANSGFQININQTVEITIHPAIDAINYNKEKLEKLIKSTRDIIYKAVSDDSGDCHQDH